MYAKVIIALCAVGLARAGGLLGAGPLAYNTIAAPALITKTIAPAVSSISAYSTKQTHPSPVLSYAAAPAIATYAAAPIITKTISPAVSSISAYSTDIAHGSPVATYGAYARPAYGAYAAPTAYAAYAAPAIKTIAPAIATYSAPLLTKTYAAPVASYAIGAPLLKSSWAYSGVPSLYNGYAANYDDWC